MKVVLTYTLFHVKHRVRVFHVKQFSHSGSGKWLESDNDPQE